MSSCPAQPSIWDSAVAVLWILSVQPVSLHRILHLSSGCARGLTVPWLQVREELPAPAWCAAVCGGVKVLERGSGTLGRSMQTQGSPVLVGSPRLGGAGG